jgi:hypothetical protein
VLPFNLWKLIHHRNYIHQPSCFFRRGLLDRAGFIREDLHYVMDWELWIRFGAYKGVFIDAFLSCNRAYAQNKTQSGALRRWREIRHMVGTYTDSRFPPVLWLYLAETLLQDLRARRLLGRLAEPLHRLFWWGMSRELSGVHADGSLEPAFAFSVPNRAGASQVRLTLSPLSRYDRSALGRPALQVSWRSGSGQSGMFALEGNGRVQEVVLPLTATTGVFTHFRCRANSTGRPIPGSDTMPGRRVVGFLDDLAVLPAEEARRSPGTLEAA